MTWAPYTLLTSFRCLAVNGFAHIKVFMAGASSIGLAGSQARTMQVRRLSQSPLASLARELADRGATTSKSAHFLS